MRYRVKY